MFRSLYSQQTETSRSKRKCRTSFLLSKNRSVLRLNDGIRVETYFWMCLTEPRPSAGLGSLALDLHNFAKLFSYTYNRAGGKLINGRSKCPQQENIFTVHNFVRLLGKLEAGSSRRSKYYYKAIVISDSRVK